jgi:cyclopropane fatty-acyl-phospholipid synthase-like methyltransferase
VSGWLAHLNNRWPERREIIEHIGQQVQKLAVTAPHVVELGSGAGQLAGYLLENFPYLKYTGLDFSDHLLAYAWDHLARFGSRATLIKADLNADDWPAQLPDQLHAIVSMQSLHDLGHEQQLDRIYRMAQPLLAPGGLLVNIDLVVPEGQPNPDSPGRQSISRHLELLRAHGYAGVACTLRTGEFGGIVAYAPGSLSSLPNKY